MTVADDDDETDSPTAIRRAYRLLLRGLRWLRDFNRGHAGTSHLPHRKK